MNPNDVLTITMRESGPLCRRTYDAPDGRRMSETLTPEEVWSHLVQAEAEASPPGRRLLAQSNAPTRILPNAP